MCKLLMSITVALILATAGSVANATLIGWYQFEGNLNDSSGAGNTPTEHGELNYSSDAKHGGMSAEFDGVFDWLTVDDAAIYATNDFTLGAWFKATAWATNTEGRDDTLFGKGNFLFGSDDRPFATASTYSLGAWGGETEHLLAQYVREGGNTDTGDGTARVLLHQNKRHLCCPVGEWVHYLATKEDDILTLYVDGITSFRLASTDGSVIRADETPLGIGAFGGGQLKINGLLDDVGMMDQAMEMEDVVALFEGTKTWGDIGGVVSAPCDLDGSSACDDVDIDLLAAAVRNGTSDPKFNVDGIGGDVPDNADFDYYITDESMLSTGLGDSDLNMSVNFVDFVNLSNDFGVSGTGWARGNFNTDDITNFNDFVALSNNFGMSFVSNGTDVPEPTTVALLLIAGLGLLSGTRRVTDKSR